MSGSDPRVADDLQALEIKWIRMPSTPPGEGQGQEVLSLLINPRGPALLLSHQDRRDEIALTGMAAKLARTVLERAVGAATVEVWLEHLHQQQLQKIRSISSNSWGRTATTATATTAASLPHGRGAAAGSKPGGSEWARRG